MGEVASVYCRTLIESLLAVHALTNMHRASDNEEFRKSAADWLPILRNQLSNLERELTKGTPND